MKIGSLKSSGATHSLSLLMARVRKMPMTAVPAVITVLVLACQGPSPAAAAEGPEWRKRPAPEQIVTEGDVRQEVLFGREVAARLLGRFRLHDEQTAMRYVNLVGRSLAANANRPEIEFRFGILETGDINAYAAPGGYVFVTTGALEHMRDEAELAGVLAHEIVHVSQKHIVRELNIQGTEDSPVAGFARLIGGSSESARLAFAKAVDKALDILLKDGYRRSDEDEADSLAAALCALSGYDPRGLSRYLDRVKSLRGAHTEVLDRTHPPFGERVERITRTIEADGLDTGGLADHKERFRQAMNLSR